MHWFGKRRRVRNVRTPSGGSGRSSVLLRRRPVSIQLRASDARSRNACALARGRAALHASASCARTFWLRRGLAPWHAGGAARAFRKEIITAASSRLLSPPRLLRSMSTINSKASSRDSSLEPTATPSGSRPRSRGTRRRRRRGGRHGWCPSGTRTRGRSATATRSLQRSRRRCNFQLS